MPQPTPGTLLSSADAVAFLTAQHEQIRSLFSDVLQASLDERAHRFAGLRRLLAVHEAAEEQVVHPRARRELADGDAIIDERLQEENQAKQALAELEALDVGSPDFLAAFAHLRDDVLAHADAEEATEFGRLRAQLGADDLQRMRRAIDLAEATAPTRPHPGVESRGANLLVGPFAAMLDRARDAIDGR